MISSQRLCDFFFMKVVFICTRTGSGELVIDNLPFDFIVGVKQQETPTSAPQYFLLSHIVISLVRQGEYVLGGNITYPVSQERPQVR